MGDSVTVIIPTWNRASLLSDAIHSVLAQTVAVSEILICDDGSSDDSREVVAAVRDKRVIWIGGEHSGLPAVPRNRGVYASTGDWLAFLDSDDAWAPDKLAKQLARTRQLGCLAVCTDAERLVPGQGRSGPLLSLTGERMTFAGLLENNQIICSSVLVRSELVENAGLFPESCQLRACEDYALWLRIATMTDFGVVGEPLVVYRDDPAHSIRRDLIDQVAQKISVINDFQTWGRKRAEKPFLKQASRMRSDLRGGIVKSLLGALWGRVKRTPPGKEL